MLTYTELIKFPTYEERLEFLRTNEKSSELTFADLRYLNQRFYNSQAWKQVREEVIARDLGFDLGIPGCHIHGKVIVHHMNPIKPKDILYHGEDIIDPEFLITVSKKTHDAIHFHISTRGRAREIIDRYLGDTILW